MHGAGFVLRLFVREREGGFCFEIFCESQHPWLNPPLQIIRSLVGAGSPVSLLNNENIHKPAPTQRQDFVRINLRANIESRNTNLVGAGAS